MKQPDESSSVEELKEYNDADAAQIGALLPHLSEKFSGGAVPKDLLALIVDSPFHTQLVVRLNNEIVGIASLSLILGAGSGHTAWLEDFVVSPTARGTGIADMLWNGMIDWCRQKQAKSLNFTSRPSREAAHRFYQRHGATIRETSVFKKPINL